MLAIWSLVPLPFLNQAWTSGSSQFTYCWSLSWSILRINLLAWDDCNCAVVWVFFGISFFGIGMKTDIFQSCGHCWVFQLCWHIECSTFTTLSLRIWNSSTGIPSPPLALLIVMLPEAHLTLHSRMSGSRWVITPSWLSGSWRLSLYSAFVYPCYLFLISSASLRDHFVPYCAHLCMKISLGIFNFLEEISSLSHSIVFLYFFALITEESFLIYPCYSLEFCINGHILPFLFSLFFPFPFLFSLFFFSWLFARPP